MLSKTHEIPFTSTELGLWLKFKSHYLKPLQMRTQFSETIITRENWDNIFLLWLEWTNFF